MKKQILCFLVISAPCHGWFGEDIFNKVKDIGNGIFSGSKKIAEETVADITQEKKRKAVLQGTLDELNSTKNSVEAELHKVTDTWNTITHMGSTLSSDVSLVVSSVTKTVNNIKDNEVPFIEKQVAELEKTELSFTIDTLIHPETFVDQISQPLLNTKQIIDHITNIVADVSDDTVNLGTLIQDVGKIIQVLSISTTSEEKTRNIKQTLADIRQKISDIQYFESQADEIIPQVLQEMKLVLTKLAVTLNNLYKTGLLTANSVENQVKAALKNDIDYSKKRAPIKQLEPVAMISIQNL